MFRTAAKRLLSQTLRSTTTTTPLPAITPLRPAIISSSSSLSSRFCTSSNLSFSPQNPNPNPNNPDQSSSKTTSEEPPRSRPVTAYQEEQSRVLHASLRHVYEVTRESSLATFKTEIQSSQLVKSRFAAGFEGLGVKGGLQSLKLDQDENVAGGLATKETENSSKLVGCLALKETVPHQNEDNLKLMNDMLGPTIFGSVPRLYNRIYAGIVNAGKTFGALKERLFNPACNSKKQAMMHGQNPLSIWDQLVFNKIKAKVGGRVRSMGSGASTFSPDVLDFLKVCFGCQVVEGYGMRETSCLITSMEEGDRLSGHVGSSNPACGDSFNSCLVAGISVDHDALSAWAVGEDIKYKDLAQLCHHPRAKAAVLADMDAVGREAGVRSFSTSASGFVHKFIMSWMVVKTRLALQTCENGESEDIFMHGLWQCLGKNWDNMPEFPKRHSDWKSTEVD